MILIKSIVILLLSLIIIKQIMHINGLLLSCKRNCIEIVAIFILGIFIFRYENNWINYLIGTLGIAYITTAYLHEGITGKGFITRYPYKALILWNEIEDIKVHKTNNIKITLRGKFIKKSFKFKLTDYDEVRSLIEKNWHK